MKFTDPPTVFPVSAKWIFLDPERYPDRQKSRITAFTPPPEKWTAAVFRKKFTVEKADETWTALIAAECCYRAWIDDEYWCDGPAESGGDYGCRKVLPWAFYDRIELPELPAGEHVITIEVTSTNGPQSNYSGGQMGLKTAFFRRADVMFVSDDSWSCRLDTAAVDPLRYDHHQEEAPVYPAAILDDALMSNREYLYSELPELYEYTARPIKIIAPFEQERLVNVNEFLAGKAPLIIKAGEPFSCYFEFEGEHAAQIELEADCNCTMHLRITAQEIAGRGPVERSPENIYTPARHIKYRSRILNAVKYINLTAMSFGRIDSPANEDLVIHKLQIHIRHYPVKHYSAFETDRADYMRLRDVCGNTLKMCMQRMHYDSPVHLEGLGCVGDYRFMALQSYYLFGEYHLARQDLRRIARMLILNNGALFHETFVLIFLLMLQEYVLYSGNIAILDLPEIGKARQLVLSRFKGFKGTEGVISEAPNFMFVDWMTYRNETMHHPSAGTGMASMTAFYLMAQLAEEKLCSYVNDLSGAQSAREEYDRVCRRFKELFYDPEKCCFINGIAGISHSQPHTFLPPDDLTSGVAVTPHPSILAIGAGVGVDGSGDEMLAKMVAAAERHEIQPYFCNYLFEALYNNGAAFDLHFERMLKLYLDLLMSHPYSMRESWAGGDYCHAWSGAPAIWFGRGMLGVMPLKPGFTEFLVKPHPGDCCRASGEVPTPGGMITVRWEKTEQGSTLFIRYPAGLHLVADHSLLPACQLETETF